MKFALSWIADFVDVEKAGGADGVRKKLALAGLPVESAERAGTDTILDVEITPNRPDAMSHRGIARDLAAMAALSMAGPNVPTPAASSAAVDSMTSVTIEVPRLCRRFGARVLTGIGAGAAPESVRTRLAAIGAKSISAAVDATNYVLWDIGQPLHAFDLDWLAGRKLIVRRAHKGEKLVTLDGVERALDPSDVVVADAERAVSLAGIMGGLATAVTGATRNVLLEAAWWDPTAIRRTARRLGMHTDASHRFERGADPEAIPEALDRAAAILLASGGGILAPGMIDARGTPWKTRRAAVRLSRLRLLSGTDLDLDFAAEALERLGFFPERRGKRLAVTVPSFRPDVSVEDDLVEEVLRVWGYDRIPSRLPGSGKPGERLEWRREVEEALADAAAGAGLLETMSAPFTDRASEEGAFAAWISEAGGVATPLAIEAPPDAGRRDLRATLLPGLLDAVARNVHHGEAAVSLFEVGRAFDRKGDPEDPPSFESRRFGFALSGSLRAHWSASGSGARADFFDAKGLAERLLALWVDPEDLRWKPFACAAFTPGAAALVAGPDGVLLGTVGLVASSERERRKLSEEVFAGELLVDNIPRRAQSTRFAAYSTFPPIEADLSFAQPRAKAWSDIQAFVESRGLAHLESVRIVDRYEGAGVPEGRVKTTIRLTFRSAERTLEQEEVNREVAKLRDALGREMGVVF